MKIIETPLQGLRLIEPKAFGDSRGYFFEMYHENRYASAGITERFVQDNVSLSQKNVLRGLHYQTRKPQAKLVFVLQGEVFDVAVDIRKNSPTFGKFFSAILNDKNHHQLLIPQGFAHGFCTLSDDVLFAYKCSDYYDPEGEAGILWNDPSINIPWPVSNPVISEKDKHYPLLHEK